jgi:hypothetical protein
LRSDIATGTRPELFPLDEVIIEVPLLLPTDQAKALEEAARLRNVTIGQLTRVLIKDFLGGSDTSPLLW